MRIMRLVRLRLVQPTSQPANQPTSQPANQPTSQPTNQPESSKQQITHMDANRLDKLQSYVKLRTEQTSVLANPSKGLSDGQFVSLLGMIWRELQNLVSDNFDQQAALDGWSALAVLCIEQDEQDYNECLQSIDNILDKLMSGTPTCQLVAMLFMQYMNAVLVSQHAS